MKNRSTIWYVWLGIGSLLLSCQSQKDKIVETSFYYWKQTFKLNEAEKQTLVRLQVKNLYVKFFDVVQHQGHAQPVADITFEESPNQNIIPCVFITNEAMGHCSEQAADSLAKQVYLRIHQLRTRYKLRDFSEFHFDCDWTPTSRVQFFRFLNQIQHLSKIKITSTLRLYQVKYPKTAGIPPTAAATLMCYNMFAPQDPLVRNSIYDLEELKKYTNTMEQYPMKLQIALPLYAWTCIFRNGQFVGYLNETRSQDLEQLTYLKKTAQNIYKCEKTFKFKGSSLSKGDLLRVEEVSSAELQEGLDFMSKHVASDTLNIVLYHLDEEILKHYEKDFLPVICPR